MNRLEQAKEAGVSFAVQQEAKRNADRMTSAALSISPEAARRLLGEWAARPGRSQAEVDALNAKGAGDAA